MKIAVCLYGLTGRYKKNNSDVYLNPLISYKNYYKNIFKNNNIDIFFHTWQDEDNPYVSNLFDLYKPKSFLIEPQIDFTKYKIDNYSMKHINTYKKIFSMTDDVYSFLNGNYIFNSHSRWYSNSVSIKLMDQYSKKNNIKYDWVLQLRFDLFIREPFPFSKLNNEFFYCCPRFHTDNDLAVNDTWFLSNHDNALKFSLIYENITNYSIWVHAAAKQHLDKMKIIIKYFPQKYLGKKNYWMMRNVLNEKKPSFIKKIYLKILHTTSKLINKFQKILDKAINNIKI